MKRALGLFCVILMTWSPVYATQLVYQNSFWQVVFASDGIEAYFPAANKMLLTSSGFAPIEIPSNAVFSAINIVGDMLQNRADNVSIEIHFDSKIDTHSFSVAGFYHAYLQFLKCSAEEKKQNFQIVTIEP